MFNKFLIFVFDLIAVFAKSSKAQINASKVDRTLQKGQSFRQLRNFLCGNLSVAACSPLSPGTEPDIIW
jgi:hypothetical protein